MILLARTILLTDPFLIFLGLQLSKDLHTSIVEGRFPEYAISNPASWFAQLTNMIEVKISVFFELILFRFMFHLSLCRFVRSFLHAQVKSSLLMKTSCSLSFFYMTFSHGPFENGLVGVGNDRTKYKEIGENNILQWTKMTSLLIYE